jgi:ketosteroid isomerase-like protein
MPPENTCGVLAAAALGDTGAVSENARVVEALHEVLVSRDGRIAIDDEAQGRLIADTLEEVAEPDFACTMIAPGEPGLRGEFHGVEGFLEAWRDWAGAFETVRLEREQLIEAGPHVVDLSRMSGIPHGGRTELVNRAAAIWSFRAGRLARVDFYLDRDAALRAAGLDPQNVQE